MKSWELVMLLLLGVGGWFAYGAIKEWRARKEARRQIWKPLPSEPGYHWWLDGVKGLCLIVYISKTDAGMFIDSPTSFDMEQEINSFAAEWPKSEFCGPLVPYLWK